MFPLIYILLGYHFELFLVVQLDLYFFFLLFAFIKTMAVVVSIREGVDVSEAILACWDDNTAGVFSAILAFWFGNRAVARYVK